MKYNILIEKTLSQRFEVEVQSPEEAIQLGIQGYKKYEFVLESGNIEAKIAVEDPDSHELTSWETIY